MSKTIRPIAIILLALLLAYSGYWFYLADRAGEYIEEHLAEWRRAGLDVRYADMAVRGFPYRLVLDFEGVRARMNGGPLDISLAAESLVAIAQPWNFRHVILETEQIDGDLSLAGGALLDGLYGLSGPRSSIHLAADGSGRISLVTGEIAWNGKAAGDSLAFHIRLPARDARQEDRNSLMAPLMAEISAEVSLTGTASLAYSLDAALRGPASTGLAGPVLQSWRDAGGTLEVADIAAAGTFGRISAEGSLSLDEAMRPLGVLVVSAADAATLVQGLVAAGLVPPAQGDILEEELAETGEPRFPLTFQEGRILLGPLQLGKAPRLTR